MDIILKYFPDLSDKQRDQFLKLDELYHDWNSKINVISRKDIDALYEHHVLHSLAIAKIIKFRPQTMVLDLGTGGGFPGIPLAIMFPETKFKLIDGTGKKIMVVKEVAQAIGLENCVAEQLRGENETGKYDFVVSRAVMPLPELVNLVKKNVASPQHNSLPNGLLCLKGGNITNEIKPYKKIADITDLGNIFEEEWFKQKFMVYIPL
ncbi:ribosomal RNA small subunit methyltransferase G [Prevotella sp. CAG:1058]|nr:ribosomal RNA small subunit methyltransferase G [Prevotella sp. CAG:1058]